MKNNYIFGIKKSDLPLAAICTSLVLGSVWGTYRLGRNIYLEHQISKAPVKIEYAKGEMPKDSKYDLCWTKKLGGFDENKDGNIDKIVEKTLDGMGQAEVKVFHPKNEQFQEKLDLLEKNRS